MHDFILEGGQRLGVSLTSEDVEWFLRFMKEMHDWNQRVNLTSLVEDEETLEKHFLDALSAWSLLAIKPGQKIMDLGTGAGIPGLVLALYARGRVEDITFYLVDAVAKKLAFVEHVAHLLDCANVRVIHSRAEDLGRMTAFREQMDTVISRAVAPLPVLLEYCLPLVRRQGRFLAMKGPAAREELKNASRALASLGGAIHEMIDLSLPFCDERRTIIVFHKTAPTPDEFPRKAGIPSRRPL